MNFEQLRSVVKNIKGKMICPACGLNFENEDIHVVSSVHDKSVLMVRCHDCHTPLLVTATLHAPAQVNHEVSAEILRNHEKSNSNEEVVVDDVLNIHEFLKDFSGDFNETFRAS